MPRKGVRSSQKRASSSRFNEAGAFMPRKVANLAREFNEEIRFNEAGAFMPRKARAIASALAAMAALQ